MNDSQVIHERLFFDAEGLRLEGILSYREDIHSGRKVLLLSPHPHFAGDMNNNVIRAAAAGMAGAGRVVFRFNYHGVEESAPPPLKEESIFDYWRQVEENRDYERAMADGEGAFRFLMEAPPGGEENCFWVGYSFGALIAALSASRPGLPKGLVLISPPFGKIDLDQVEAPACPVLILAGDRDFVYDPAALEKALPRLGGHAVLEKISGADHFFRGEESMLTDRVIRFLDEHEGR